MLTKLYRIVAAASLCLLGLPYAAWGAEPPEPSSPSPDDERPLTFAMYDVEQGEGVVRIVVTSPSARSTLTVPGVAEGSLKGVRHPALVISSRLVEVMANPADSSAGASPEAIIKKHIASEVAHVERAMGATLEVRSRPGGGQNGPKGTFWEFDLPQKAPTKRAAAGKGRTSFPIKSRLNLSMVSGSQVLGVSVTLEEGDDAASWSAVLDKTLASLKTERLRSESAKLPKRCIELAGPDGSEGADRLYGACASQASLGCVCLSSALLGRGDAPSLQLGADALSFACDREDALACSVLSRIASDRSVAGQLQKKACRLGLVDACGR